MLDSSQGSHIYIVNGKIVRYGQKISGEEYEELRKENPGMVYAPIVEEEPVVIRFSSVPSLTMKEWQVCVTTCNNKYWVLLELSFAKISGAHANSEKK